MNAENEHRLDCLARWMLSHWKTKEARQASLNRMEKRHGKRFVEDLKRRMMKEWEKLK